MEIYKNRSMEKLDNEIWIIIKKFPNYMISNLGRVKSIRKKLILKQLESRSGHLRVKISGCKILVHRLVFENFNNCVIDNYIIHHEDFNPKNNEIGNLTLMLKDEHIELHVKNRDYSGKNNPMYGIRLIGKRNGMFGKKHKKETIEKISKKRIGKYIGENCPSSKLKEWQVKSIYQISNSTIVKRLKISQKEIGNVFGVNDRTVSNIKNTKTWKHLNLGESISD